MFSLGWMEISIILIITVIVVGPKEIPTVIKFIKGITSGLGKISREFKYTVKEITQLEEVKDNKKDILKTLKNSINSNDIIIMTGGLGPTNDDITKNWLSEFFNSTLTLNEEALNDIKTLFEKRNLELTKKNISQAYLPKCAKKITNLKPHFFLITI